MSTTARRIYLDHNATTPTLPQAVAAMQRVYKDNVANPASQHAAGRKARQILEEARERIAEILGARVHTSRADRLIFTSGGTEANNLAIMGLAGREPAHFIASAIEHPSVGAVSDELSRRGWEVAQAPVSTEGVVLVDALAELIRPETRLVSIMLANNETGVVQPVSTVAELCTARGVLLHTDAAQAVGRIPIDFSALGVASLALSGHKFHAPPGIGALLVRREVTLEPQWHGGHQQEGLRPGTEPVALVAGLAAALEEWHREQNQVTDRLRSLRDRFEASLVAQWPEAVIQGQEAERLPQTSNVAFPGLDRQALVMALDLAGVCCSTGSACASGSAEPSPTLLAMGCARDVVEGALRFSWGRDTTADDIDQATSRIVKICKELQSRKTRGNFPAGGRRDGPILVD